MRGAGRCSREGGAAAVEFALVMFILFPLLFGLVQYGYGLFQLQAAQATAREAAVRAAKGLQDCDQFDDVVQAAAEGNGMPLTVDPSTGDDGVTLTSAPATAPQPETRDRLRSAPLPGGTSIGDDVFVTIAYRPHIMLPLVPFPDVVERRSRTRVERVDELTDLRCP